MEGRSCHLRDADQKSCRAAIPHIHLVGTWLGLVLEGVPCRVGGPKEASTHRTRSVSAVAWCLGVSLLPHGGSGVSKLCCR